MSMNTMTSGFLYLIGESRKLSSNIEAKSTPLSDECTISFLKMPQLRFLEMKFSRDLSALSWSMMSSARQMILSTKGASSVNMVLPLS